MKIKDCICRNFCWLLFLPAILIFNACTAVGPPTVARDRFDYVNAMSESWKRQMLINLVKIRYMDAPVFLDVASIINQYSLEGEISLGAAWSDPILGDSQTVGGTGRYADRPTTTYAPPIRRSLYSAIGDSHPGSGYSGFTSVGIPVGYKDCGHRREGVHWHDRGRVH